MKCSKIYFWGMLGTGVYTLGILIPGIIDMKYYGQINNTDQSSLDEANNQYNAALSAYQNTQNNIYAAQSTINYAQCYINNKQNFELQLQNYCLNTLSNINSLSTLTNYGIQLVNIADNTIITTGSSTYRSCPAPTTAQPCSASNKNCKSTPAPTRCNYITYNFPQYTYEHRGATAQGSGSQIILSCDTFTYALAISAQTTASTSEWSTSINLFNGLISQQQRNTYYSSTITIPANFESTSATNVLIYNLNPSTNNLAAAANSVLSLLQQQCNLVNNSLKPISHYQAIINASAASLISFQSTLATQDNTVNQTLTYKNQQQAIFDSANSQYRHSLSIWLPLLFIPPIFIIWALCHKENKYKSTNYINVGTFDTKNLSFPTNPCAKNSDLSQAPKNTVPPLNPATTDNANYLDSEAAINLQPQNNFYLPASDNLDTAQPPIAIAYPIAEEVRTQDNFYLPQGQNIYAQPREIARTCSSEQEEQHQRPTVITATIVEPSNNKLALS